MPTELPAPRNDELLGLLGEWASDPKSDPRAFFEKLLGSTLVVVMNGGGGEAPSFLVAQRNGQTFLAAFTGDAALRRMSEPASRVLHVKAQQLCAEVAAKGPDGLLLDPAGPVTCPLSRAQCQRLGMGQVTDESGGPLHQTPEDFEIGRPTRRLPEAVMAKLVAAVKQEGVARALWFWVKRPGVTEPQLAIAIVPPEPALLSRVSLALWAERETLVAAKLPSQGSFVVLPCEGQLAETLEVASELLYDAGPAGPPARAGHAHETGHRHEEHDK